MTLPEADGGLGLGIADAAIVFEELGRALVPGPLVATYLASELTPGPPPPALPALPSPAQLCPKLVPKLVPELCPAPARQPGPGSEPVTMLDLRDPVPVVEHLASASRLVVVADDGLFLLPAAGSPQRPWATRWTR